VEQVDLVGSLAGRSIGFFHQEPGPDGGPVRWTAALAMVKVNVPGTGIARARLELMPFVRPADVPPPDPRIAVDGRRVSIRVGEDAIEFQIEGGEHWISIGSRPFRPSHQGADDPRSLGLPVRSLGFEPL
jgi:hypothetical protein